MTPLQAIFAIGLIIALIISGIAFKYSKTCTNHEFAEYSPAPVGETQYRIRTESVSVPGMGPKMRYYLDRTEITRCSHSNCNMSKMRWSHVATISGDDRLGRIIGDG